jgi:cell division protein FtsN
MAAKRNKSQARRNTSNDSSMPGWAWLVIGLALGVGVFLIAPKFLGTGEGFFRATQDTGAQPPALDGVSDGEPIVNDSDAPAVTTERAAKPQDYDFYTLLPGEETALSDAELAERARAEEAARQAADAQKPPKPAENPDAADTITPPAIDTPAPTVANTTTTAEPVTTPKPAVAAAARDDVRYLLQAGAFAASGDAEALKAKIAFLGVSARVESAQIKDKTVYRVRMGPYGTATELAEAKRKLTGGGLPAMAIKAK